MDAPKRRVAHVLGASAGGIRRHVLHLAQHPPSGYITHGVWGPRDLAEYFAAVPFHATSPMNRMRWPRGADVVHVHGLDPAVGLVRPRRVPVVLTVHTDIETQGRAAGSKRLRRLARFLGDRADAVIAPSERVAASFPHATVVAPATPRLHAPRRSRIEVRAELGTPLDTVVVIAVARLHPDKRLEAFVEAVSAIGRGAEGWICGDGPERERLTELVRRRPGVRLLGQRDDVGDLLAAADVFALFPVGEAYGIAVLEAIQSGLPVVATDVGAIRDLVGDAGVVVGAEDEIFFSRAVARIATDDAFRQTLAANARRRALPSPEGAVESIGRVYDRVLR